MLRFQFALVLALLYASTASAATWADSLFDELSRDFGSVPRGPSLVHPFRVVNKTNGPVQIGNIRVSCNNCTTAKALQTNLAPGQETIILVEMDTNKFSGSKNVTIFVTFNQPRTAEVRLWVQANSRDDVSVLPESLAFGKVKRGAEAATSATITFLGNPNWRITAVATESNYVVPLCEQLRAEGGEVIYKLTATLRPEAPAGKWFTDVWLHTNNPASPRIRVPLTVEIEAALTISPTLVSLGEVKAGKATQKRVLLRGIRPFRVLAVQGADAQLSVAEDTSENAEVHVLLVTFRPQQPGALQRTLRVITDLPGQETIEFSAMGQVVR